MKLNISEKNCLLVPKIICMKILIFILIQRIIICTLLMRCSCRREESNSCILNLFLIRTLPGYRISVTGFYLLYSAQ